MRIVIATGVSGCNRKGFLAAWQKYCKEQDRNVKIFDVGEMMFEHLESIGIDLNRKNIFQVSPLARQIARSAVLKSVLDEITYNAGKYDAVVVNIHALFYWDDVFSEAYDVYLNNFFKKEWDPLLVTFIDDFRPILQRLTSRDQWRGQSLDARKVLTWQNLEIVTTSMLAKFAKIKWYPIATTQLPEDLFYPLVFHPELMPAYIAMPISHLRHQEARIPVDNFIERLRNLRKFPLFNPLSVEVVGAVHFDKKESTVEDALIYHHIVNRDLYWFVESSPVIIVYWPKIDLPKEVEENPLLLAHWPESIASPGVDHETHEGYTEGKDILVTFCGLKSSPFLIKFCTELFLNEEDFFEYVKTHYPDIIGRW